MPVSSDLPMLDSVIIEVPSATAETAMAIGCRSVAKPG